MSAPRMEFAPERWDPDARLTHGLWGDVRLAARRLLASPLFLVFAILSLAIGLAVTITAYSVVEAVFWPPLGIADAGRVGIVTAARDGQRPSRSLSRSDFDELQRTQRSFSSIAARKTFSDTLVISGGGEAAYGEAVTGEFFAVIRVNATVGRTIQPQDDAEATAVVVLSDRLWRSKFGRDPNIVGQVVRLGGHPFEIIGVAPNSYRGIGASPRDVWVPFSALRLFTAANDLARPDLTVIGRLHSGQSMSRGAAEIAAIGNQLDGVSPIRRPPAAGGTPATIPRRWSAQEIDRQADEARPLGVMLLAIVGLALFVAATNLANLMLARGTLRQHEFAVRRALGASRWRLVREQVVEAGLIALLGGLATVAMTRVMFRAFPAALPDNGMTFYLDPAVSPAVIAVAASGLLVALLTFGLEPALHLTRRSVTSDLASEAGVVGLPRVTRQRAFIRWQVAVCTCLFLITAILARVVFEETRHDPGIDLDRLTMARILGASSADEPRVEHLMAAALEAARQNPSIEATAVSTGLPFGMGLSTATASTPDRLSGLEDRLCYLMASTPDIFRTLGVPLVAGRSFEDRDDSASERVAIVSELTARQLFGGNVIGRQIVIQPTRQPAVTATVVGVAGDTDTGNFLSRDTGMIYLPFSQRHSGTWTYLIARTSGDTAAAAGTLQAALRRADPDLRVAEYGAAPTFLMESYVLARMTGTVAAGLSLLTLLLAMVGLYGVQSQVAMHRTREVGLRVALGATARQIERMMLSEGFRPVMQGVALGLAFGTVARLAIRVLIGGGIHPTDPLALVVAPIPLALAAYLACRIPAHRATGVDPNVALRHL